MSIFTPAPITRRIVLRGRWRWAHIALTVLLWVTLLLAAAVQF